MKRKALFLSALLSIVFLAVWLLPVARAATEDTVTAMELPLSSQGTAFEINADDSGALWISDIDADEIWHVEPGGQYTIYGSIASPSDARRDGVGDVWWGQWEGNSLGRLSPSNGQVTTWAIPGALSLLGVQIDAGGHVWLSENSGPYLYRFEPDSTQLCTYTIPDSGAAEYLAVEGQELWFGDWKNDRIFRLQSQSNTVTYWELDTESFPEGVSLDVGGNFWWADSEVGGVARLEPAADRVTRFQRPVSGTAQMLAVAGETVWYSGDQLGTVTRVEASSAGGTSATVTRQSETTVPSCSELGPGSPSMAAVSSDVATWSQQTLNTLYASAAWDVLELPAGSFPWGIAIADEAVWVVEPGRQVLIRGPELVDVAACKQRDGDGDLATSDDRTSMSGWPVSLRISETQQLPLQDTGVAGCYTWPNLPAGRDYGVQEEVLSGWMALTDTYHDFGTSTAGGSYTFTFINEQAESFQYLPVLLRP